MTDQKNTVIEVHNLIKHYPKAEVNAVDDISFSVERGELLGLLGPNGAGKTTVIGILTTSVIPTGGNAYIMGIDVVADPMRVKQKIAVVSQRNNLDRHLTAREILTFHASYHGVPRAIRNARADKLLTEFGLSHRGKETVGHYSRGMVQRIMLATALMHNPRVLFLDEPTNNLDPQSRLFLWDRIRTLREQGVTILLTTHDMEEASRLCDRIAIIDHGHILVLDTPAALKQQAPENNVLELRIRVPGLVSAGSISPDDSMDISPRKRLLDIFSELPGVSRAEEVVGKLSAGKARPDPSELPDALKRKDTVTLTEREARPDSLTYHLYAENADSLITSAVEAVKDVGGEFQDLRLMQTSLEDIFISLTGRKLRS